MRLIRDQSWTRRGISLLWNAEILSQLVTPEDVVSIRQLFMLVNHWPQDLPAAGGNALVVAGIDGCVDALTPEDAHLWLQADLKSCILSFQDEYEGQAGLVFWLPSGRKRISMTPATDAYLWRCAAPFSQQSLPIGQALWAGAESDAERIISTNESDLDIDGSAWIGLHHPRIS